MTPLAPSPRRVIVCALQAALCAGLLGLLSLETHTLFLFPALGASAFILIVFPGSPAALPRNVIGAHLVGATMGWLAFTTCGLAPLSATLVSGGGPEHVLAVALALGLTTAAMIVLKLYHPPAGATTLIVSLGLLPYAWQIGMVGASALLLVLLVRVLARLAAPFAPAGSESALPPGLVDTQRAEERPGS